ncbi:histidine phosphatase family protein [Kribbella capetownensis]|uniref:Histidine phosphatase family protein n=1 Tax=Kribbella capetownensis TaxID=1572659 RepID=A0A4R0JTP6_9ACTN|nr:histidine phosphatase family protein [Kribbella capetownensis]
MNAGMPRVFLVRHGEPGCPQIDAEGWRGPIRDLAPLTADGIEQAKTVGRELRAVGAHRIVASPMTRALQTASLIAAETQLPLTAVEFDLREWRPDSTLSWGSLADIQALSKDFEACEGEWPGGEARLWEPLSSVRRRALSALQRQASEHPNPFIAVCHSVVIRALTGHTHTELCGIRVLDNVS